MVYIAFDKLWLESYFPFRKVIFLGRAVKLQVVVSKVFYFHPENWERFPFRRAYFFRWVGSTTNQIYFVLVVFFEHWRNLRVQVRGRYRGEYEARLVSKGSCPSTTRPSGGFFEKSNDPKMFPSYKIKHWLFKLEKVAPNLFRQFFLSRMEGLHF